MKPGNCISIQGTRQHALLLVEHEPQGLKQDNCQRIAWVMNLCGLSIVNVHDPSKPGLHALFHYMNAFFVCVHIATFNLACAHARLCSLFA